MLKALILSLFFMLSFKLSAMVEELEVLLLMGSRFEIHVIADDEARAKEQLNVAIGEIRRIEAMISSWNADSETSRINTQAGIQAVPVSAELFSLIERSIQISKLTQGAFDITAVVMNKLWKFDGSMKAFPSEDEISDLSSLIDYNNIILDKKKQTVFLKKKGMKIGFGSIGKGYAAQSAAQILKANGIKSGVINAAGDLYAWGKSLDNTPWQVGIIDPKEKEKMYAWVDIEDMAIVTSGDYEKTIEINGKQYSHIIDPRTAYPVSNGVRSVTIISNNAEFADALATGVFVLGSEVGLYLVNKLDGVEAIIVNVQKEIITSNNVHLNMEEY